MPGGGASKDLRKKEKKREEIDDDLDPTLARRGRPGRRS